MRRILSFLATMTFLVVACVEPHQSLPTGIYEDASSQYCLRVTKDRIEVLSFGSQRPSNRDVPTETCRYTLRPDKTIWLYGMTSNQALVRFKCEWDGRYIVMDEMVMGKPTRFIRLERVCVE